MKKTTQTSLMIAASFFYGTLLNGQNVGIGTTNPLATLHIKNNNEALRIEGTTSYISFYDNAGINKGFLQNYNNDIYLGTPAGNTTGIMQFYLGNAPIMTMRPTGNIVVGGSATVPFGKFTVQTLNNSYGISHLGEGGNVLATFMGGTSAGIGTFSNTNMRIFSNSNSAIFVAAATSNVGIGTENPLDKLSVLTQTSTSGITHTDGNISVSTYVGGSTGGGWIGTRSNHPFSFYTNNGGPSMTVATNGSIGIGSTTPTNKLQIGSIGATGFGNNDLAIGNGTAAMAIYQTNTATLIGSSTDIILKPRNNGLGRVGINTNFPRAALEVADYVDISFSGAYDYLNLGSALTGILRCNNCTAGVSIYAARAIIAEEFDARSDARIKNITGISNSANDLLTINALQITDYTLKDKVLNGNKPFKKIIAQEVEKVYPQVVSKHVDFIPNVYQLTNKIEKTGNGYLLTFSSKHNISKEAKKLRVLLSEGQSMEQFDIVIIPSDYQVVINATDLKTNKAFVYGEQVDDFRTVDYEGLTTLNISATQELTKLVKKQQVAIEALIDEIRKMKEKHGVGFQ